MTWGQRAGGRTGCLCKRCLTSLAARVNAHPLPLPGPAPAHHCAAQHQYDRLYSLASRVLGSSVPKHMLKGLVRAYLGV